MTDYCRNCLRRDDSQIGIQPLKTSLANKLFDLNVCKYFKQITMSYHGHLIRVMKTVKSSNIESVNYQISGKFTIVEIVSGGHHYYGLAARAPCDHGKKGYAGIAIAYHRAFKSLCEDIL